MSARSETYELGHRLDHAGIKSLSYDDVDTLRKAAKTLSRWDGRCCGDGSGCIEYDDDTGRPLWRNAMTGDAWPIPNREAGAERRIARVCTEHGLHWYHQRDPRGCSLYVSRDPINDTNYLRGVACCVG